MDRSKLSYTSPYPLHPSLCHLDLEFHPPVWFPSNTLDRTLHPRIVYARKSSKRKKPGVRTFRFLQRLSILLEPFQDPTVPSFRSGWFVPALQTRLPKCRRWFGTCHGPLPSGHVEKKDETQMGDPSLSPALLSDPGNASPSIEIS